MEFYSDPVPFVIVRNFFPSDELKIIWAEIEKMKPMFGGPEKTGSARGVTGVAKKDNKGIFLPPDNPICLLNKKVKEPEFIFKLSQNNWFWNFIKHCDHVSTLVSYYEDSGHYLPHTDHSVVTAIHYIWKEPKTFTGGGIFFGDFEVPIDNNCLLIFPSCTHHEVKECHGSGRYALTQFMSMENEPSQGLPAIRRFENVFAVTDFNKIAETIRKGCWTSGGRSNDATPIKFLYMDLIQNEFFNFKLMQKIEQVTGMQFGLDRVYANGQWHGLDGSFHQDSQEPGTWTFVLYLNEIASEDLDGYGGCTEFKKGEGLVESYQPTTNSALLFPSVMWHRGMGPSRFVPDMRVTVAWKLREMKRN